MATCSLGGTCDVDHVCELCPGTSARSKAPSAIDHPPHYSAGGIEAIDVIEAWELGFCLGNAVKYIARAGRKDPARELEDLEKAAWYLAREIERRRSDAKGEAG